MGEMAEDGRCGEHQGGDCVAVQQCGKCEQELSGPARCEPPGMVGGDGPGDRGRFRLVTTWFGELFPPLGEVLLVVRQVSMVLAITELA